MRAIKIEVENEDFDLVMDNLKVLFYDYAVKSIKEIQSECKSNPYPFTTGEYNDEES